MDVNRGFTMLLPLAAALCLLNAKARADSLPVGGAAVDRVSHVQCGSPTTFVTLAHPGGCRQGTCARQDPGDTGDSGSPRSLLIALPWLEQAVSSQNCAGPQSNVWGESGSGDQRQNKRPSPVRIPDLGAG